MNNNLHTLLIISIISLVTCLLRFLPFVIFKKQTPKYIVFLADALPAAIMGMLVVYCLKSVNALSFPFGLPEFLSVLIVAILHLWKRNVLLSIGVGTIIYMLLVQFVF